MELVDKLIMIDLVQRFTEIKQYDIGLLTCLHVLVKFLYKHDELRLTGSFSTETVLEVIEDLIVIEVFHYVWRYDVL